MQLQNAHHRSSEDEPACALVSIDIKYLENQEIFTTFQYEEFSRHYEIHFSPDGKLLGVVTSFFGVNMVIGRQ